MKLPRLFMQIHQTEIEKCFHKYGPIFCIEPKEPLGEISLEFPPPDEMTITTVTIRCINDRGVMRAEAFSARDLAVAAEWAEKHRDTPIEDFMWRPSLVGH